MRAASVIGKDVMSGRTSSWQATVSRRELPSFPRAPPASRRHAGHIISNYDTAGHSLTSRLCRLPDSQPKHFAHHACSCQPCKHSQPADGRNTINSHDHTVILRPCAREMSSKSTSGCCAGNAAAEVCGRSPILL
jgi:hypothetical protein